MLIRSKRENATRNDDRITTSRNPTGIAVALIGVILKGVHPEFVRATRHAQGKDDR